MKKKLDLSFLIIAIVILCVTLVLHFVGDYTDLLDESIELYVVLPLTLIAYLLISYPYFIKAFRHIKNKQFFDEIVLTLIATIAAFAIQEFVEALAVMVFFRIGEYIENIGYKKSQDSLKSIFEMRPDNVTLYDNGIEKVVDPYDVKIDDTFIVKPGERIPLDGVIVSGKSSLDTSSMTGESKPVSAKEGDEVISGCVNQSSPIIIKAQKEFYASTLNQVLELVENATNTKTKEEKFISKFAKIYTPIVVLLAVLVAIIPPLFIGYNDASIWSQWIYTGATFLVVSCPCSLVISVPMAFYIGIGKASQYKAIVKGSVYIEKLRKLDTIVLDKTGTITKGNFEVSNIDKYSDDYDIVELANIAEHFSNHPIAKAIKNIAKDYKYDPIDIKNYTEVEGKGIYLLYKNKELIVGNASLMEQYDITYKVNQNVGTIIYVAYDKNFIGSITIKDIIKDTSVEGISNFYKNGINDVYMLTGDNELVANDIAKVANINHVYASLLPQQKGEILKDIIAKKDKNSVVAFVGDGVNDALSLKLADLGISMGGLGSDAAVNSSDIVLMDDNLNTVNTLKNLANSTLAIVYQNIILSIGIKVIVLALNASQLLGSYAMWLSIFGDVGVTLICVLNSLRLLKKNIKVTKSKRTKAPQRAPQD